MCVGEDWVCGRLIEGVIIVLCGEIWWRKVCGGWWGEDLVLWVGKF